MTGRRMDPYWDDSKASTSALSSERKRVPRRAWHAVLPWVRAWDPTKERGRETGTVPQRDARQVAVRAPPTDPTRV